ncbi:hypothetical protein PoB_007623900 [Plakobranchus ocellatus]|uniref:Uncharacterized protein n=1 Tax=Plakobranchus ocellatus TaxID=259542 RepID=A0AAV4DZR2_9GAST|nr:hypothetical protein PoB_007623900 [Plakobranchus ocellatus]
MAMRKRLMVQRRDFRLAHGRKMHEPAYNPHRIHNSPLQSEAFAEIEDWSYATAVQSPGLEGVKALELDDKGHGDVYADNKLT